ncbi:MAG: hypothetical protein ACKOCX_05475 [Planctomycetota bacterium]
MLGAVKATIFTEGFGTDLTAEVSARLAEIARRPLPSTKKLKQEITAADRQLKRLTDRLDKADVTHLDAVIAKADEMGRQLAAKRERLKELQRARRQPGVTSVRGQDVVAALGRLRELLEGNVSVAAQVLKALVGDVVIESRPVEGQRSPDMFATFRIDGIPALAALDRGKGAWADDPTVGVWEFLNADRWTMPEGGPGGRQDIVVLLRRTPKHEAILPEIVKMAEAGAGVDRVSRALGVGADVVRDALKLHRTGRRPAGRIDSRFSWFVWWPPR